VQPKFGTDTGCGALVNQRCQSVTRRAQPPTRTGCCPFCPVKLQAKDPSADDLHAPYWFYTYTTATSQPHSGLPPTKTTAPTTGHTAACIDVEWDVLLANDCRVSHPDARPAANKGRGTSLTSRVSLTDQAVMLVRSTGCMKQEENPNSKVALSAVNHKQTQD